MIYVYMRLSYKYRIYPNNIQKSELGTQFYLCKNLYNAALEEKISFYKKFGKNKNYYDQQKLLPEIKQICLEYKNVYSQTLQATLWQVDLAFQSFFQRIKKRKTPGFPRFKGKDQLQSICFPQCNLQDGGVKLLTNTKVKISKLTGEVKVVWDRQFQGNVKQVIIKRKANKYYLILSCDNVLIKKLPKANKTTAIDLGLISFLTTDLKENIISPKPWKTAKEKLAFLQRKLSLKKKGSNNRDKAKLCLAKQHERVSNIRKDFHHKTTNKLIKENDIIYAEKLDVKAMLEGDKNYLNSNIQDAGWYQFIEFLLYKAEKAGREIILVNPKNTSKTCSSCLKIKEDLTLSDRIFKCECGLKLDRDHNAAINIRRVGTTLATEKSVSEIT